MSIPSGEGRRQQCPLESKKELEVLQKNKGTNFAVPGEHEQREEPKEGITEG